MRQLVKAAAVAVMVTSISTMAGWFSKSNDELLFDVVDDLNQSTPMRIDSVTMLKSAMYVKHTNTLVYFNIIDNGTIIDNRSAKRTLEPIQKTFWCTDPVQRDLLEIANIQYKYSKENGTFMFNTNIKLSDCK